MCAQTISEEDPAAAVIVPRSPFRVVSVEALPDFCLKVRCVDGTEGVVDMRPLVHAPDAGVFAPLADPQLFAQVFVNFGVVTWPGELDLAPDAMHAAFKRDGRWIPV